MNKKKIQLSIIIPTINPLYKLKSLFKSIYISEKLSNIKFNYEIIIISQSQSKNFKNYFNQNIRVYYSFINNLSKAKNIGVNKANGNLICFLDDDVEVEKNFLKTALLYRKNFFFGCIKLSNTNNFFNKRMKRFEQSINKNNFGMCLASAMFFSKKNNMKFDERFGLGSKYSSSEESDLIIRFIKKNKVFYNPKIIIYHPNVEDKSNLIDIKLKFFSYGFGHGAFLKKNSMKIYFFKFLTLNFILLLFVLNYKNFYKRLSLILGSISGYINYNR